MLDKRWKRWPEVRRNQRLWAGARILLTLAVCVLYRSQVALMDLRGRVRPRTEMDRRLLLPIKLRLLIHGVAIKEGNRVRALGPSSPLHPRGSLGLMERHNQEKGDQVWPVAVRRECLAPGRDTEELSRETKEGSPTFSKCCTR